MTASAAPPPMPTAAQPFTCSPGKVILEVGNTQLYSGTFGAGNISFAPFGSQAGYEWNAMGFNESDGYLYAVNASGDDLLRFSGDGSVTDLGQLSQNLSFGTSGPANIGAFDASGTFWATQTHDDTIYGIDPATRQVTSVPMSEALDVSDAAFADGYLWGMSTTNLRRLDLSTGQVINVPLNGASTIPITSVGGAFTYGNGDLGFYDQLAASLYRVHVNNPGSANPTATVLSSQNAPSNGVGDAASCFRPASVPTGVDLQVTIDSPPAVEPAADIDYTVTVHNNGPDPSTGWTVTNAIPAGLTDVTTSTPGCTITAAMVSCTGGTLPVGGDAVIEFTGTAPASGTVTVPATVYANEADTDPSNDTDSTDTQIAATPGAPMVSGEAIGAAGGAAALIGGVLLLIRRRKVSETD